jgi:hypothetical protein
MKQGSIKRDWKQRKHNYSKNSNNNVEILLTTNAAFI